MANDSLVRMCRRFHIHVGVLLIALVAAGACDRGPVRPHVSLDPSLEGLRTRFNADAAHTRLMMIVAPT